MLPKQMVIQATKVDQILSGLNNREVALWVQLTGLGHESSLELLPFLALPWKLVLLEGVNPKGFIDALEAANSLPDAFSRRRGFIHLVDSDPSRMELPPQCLPIYLLNGRNGLETESSFSSKLRRLTMLEELRRSGVRQLVVMTPTGIMPEGLKDLFGEGFAASLTVISDAPSEEDALASWLHGLSISAVNLFRRSLSDAAKEIVGRFSAEFPEERRVVRIRDVQGRTSLLDITELDDSERPILGQYSIIEERDLAALMPGDLSEDDLVAFFRDSTLSWKPYAAGLPWLRHEGLLRSLRAALGRLDSVGSGENSIAYISAEAGAGGTTLARMLAWAAAKEGYPTLLADQLPFDPDALPLANMLNRVDAAIRTRDHADSVVFAEGAGAVPQESRRYEAPWLIVFDVVHWRSRESELLRFRNELVKSGRPALLLVVTGPITPTLFYNASIFKKFAELNHEISKGEAKSLGLHLNSYLATHGKARQIWEWERFYADHSVNLIEGAAAFWLSLSFWVQGQYDLSESIQQWMYRCFKAAVPKSLMPAVLQIAALSAERVPMPEGLLPAGQGKWPVSHLLDDAKGDLAPLGLTSVKSQGKRYWALLHDVLGRFLINALFYDYGLRSELGFEDVKDAEHLRFRLLRTISKNPVLGERDYRPIGEEFATSLFKIDPDHGRRTFAPYWREALASLEEMPPTLLASSRVFRHHVAVSRRRIAKLDAAFYDVSPSDKVKLLTDAISDLMYALEKIEFRPGSESDLNLYNSLANAYLDLANAEGEVGASELRISELRELANAATRRAYDESPTNSFVLETYVKNLIENAKTPSPSSVEICIEALGILFSALTSGAAGYRLGQLSDLANQALALLFKNSPLGAKDKDFRSPVDVLVAAWKELASDDSTEGVVAFADVSEAARQKALAVLADPIGRGNLQVIHLTYDLVSISSPHAYSKQLELAEQLVRSQARPSPQLRLEYAILLYQSARANEGDREFRALRQLWRESDYLVQVPERLRWLHAPDSVDPLVVNAVTGSDYGSRAFAKVREFGNAAIPFRAQEFGLRELRPGLQITGVVSFGHNGPFLRPTTVHVLHA